MQSVGHGGRGGDIGDRRRAVGVSAHDSAPTLRAVRVPPRPERRSEHALQCVYPGCGKRGPFGTCAVTGCPEGLDAPLARPTLPSPGAQRPSSLPPPRRAPAPRRSYTPPTLRTSDVQRLDVVLSRLQFALRTADTLNELRHYLVELAADVESVVSGDRAAPELRVSEVAPDTLPSPQAELAADDAAPSTPYGTDIAEEFGPGDSEWLVLRGAP